MASKKDRIIIKITAGIVLALISGSLVSCDPGRVYEEYRTVNNSSWNEDSLLTFDVNIKEVSSSYNILFNVRNKGTYKYNNLWLFIYQHQPDGETVIDSMEVTLADPVTGEWYGKGMSGLYDKQYAYRENINFPDTGRYVFEIQQGMYTENGNLKGIKDFGLRVEKAD